MPPALQRSYRTYEEWKRCLAIWKCWHAASSYRTYEEWKQQRNGERYITVEPVLTVPMRNGNTVSPNPKEETRWVLTVPMRNGNWNTIKPFANQLLGSYRTYEEWKPHYNHLLLLCKFKFLPYLWGMETFNVHFWIEDLFQFLPYLWGMETLRCLRSNRRRC